MDYIAYQAPLSMGFSRQEYWSGLLFPSPEDLPDPGIKPGSPVLAGDSGSISGWEDPLEEEMVTHSSTLAWEILWTEKPERLQSMGWQNSQT